MSSRGFIAPGSAQQILAKNTPRKKESTSRPTVTARHFELSRRDLMYTLPEEIPELEVEWFLTNLLPPLKSAQLSAIVNALQPVIPEGRWRWYPSNPKSMAGVEDAVYKHMEDISNVIIGAAEKILEKPLTSRFHCRPRHTEKSESQNGNYKNDGNQLLLERTGAGPLKDSDFYSVDSIATWEFKKETTPPIVNKVSKN